MLPCKTPCYGLDFKATTSLQIQGFYQVRNPMFIVDKRLEAFNDKCLKRALNSITHTVT